MIGGAVGGHLFFHRSRLEVTSTPTCFVTATNSQGHHAHVHSDVLPGGASYDAACNRVHLGSIALLSLAAGSFLYLLFRSSDLLMFHWFSAFGLGAELSALRGYLSPLRPLLPDALLFSAPFALWTLSIAAMQALVWAEHRSSSATFWVLSGPAIAISSEVLQCAQVLPGTFDPVDLFFLLLILPLAQTLNTLTTDGGTR